MTNSAIHDALRGRWITLDAVPPGWSCEDALAYFLFAAYEDSDHVDELLGVLRDARQRIDAAIVAVEEAGT